MGVCLNILSKYKKYDKLNWKEEMYILILKNCNVILSYQGYIDEVSRIKLNIAGFDR